MTDTMIPHVPVSRTDMARYESIMRQGNRLLKKWAMAHFGHKNKTRAFRKLLFKGEIDTAKLGMPRRDLTLINKVRNIEEAVLFGFVRKAQKLAKRAYRSNFTYLEEEDLFMEALIIIRECVYSFSKNDAIFHTYVHTSIRRGIRRKINEANDLTGFSEDDMLLLTSFRRAQEKVGTAAPVEKVVELMDGLDPEQIERLRDLTIRFVRSSEMERGDEDCNSYQNLGVEAPVSIQDEPAKAAETTQRVVKHLEVTVPTFAKQATRSNSHIARMLRSSGSKRQSKVQLAFHVMPDDVHEQFRWAIEQAELTPLERELVEAQHRGERRFQARIARKHINPETGEPYSRMTACNKLRDAMRRVMAIVEDLAVAC